MSGICGINWIAPRWGLGCRAASRMFYKALPYAIDFGLSAQSRSKTYPHCSDYINKK
jgi:hypothetical protein